MDSAKIPQVLVDFDFYHWGYEGTYYTVLGTPLWKYLTHTIGHWIWKVQVDTKYDEQ